MRKVVHQYDLSGNYITTFNSVTEAANATNLDRIRISECINGKCRRVGNFMFRVIKQDKIKPYYKPVHLYDLEGNYIKSFNSVVELAKCLEISERHLNMILKSNNKTYKIPILNYMISYTKVDKVPAWVKLKSYYIPEDVNAHYRVV